MASSYSYEPNYTVPPGAVLDEHREAAALSQAELAERLGFSVKHVNRLLAGHEPVTPDTALKLEAVFALPARVWLALEARYRETLARTEERARLVEELGWLEQIPHRSLAQLGWIPQRLRGAELVRALRAFFSVGSLDYLPTVWSEVRASYRKSSAFQSHEWALLAWLAQGERVAIERACAPYDASALRAALGDIKALSRMQGTDFVDPLIARCANLGVALVFVPAPVGARACGATRWLATDKVLVQLSLRYRTDDQLWFTLFHELGHVLLHGKKEHFVDFAGGDEESDQEREANEFASRSLVAPAAITRFIANGDFSTNSLRAFAQAQDVAPGIVVGQLQNRRVVPFNSALNKLKTSFRWAHVARADA